MGVKSLFSWNFLGGKPSYGDFGNSAQQVGVSFAGFGGEICEARFGKAVFSIEYNDFSLNSK